MTREYEIKEKENLYILGGIRLQHKLRSIALLIFLSLGFAFLLRSACTSAYAGNPDNDNDSEIIGKVRDGPVLALSVYNGTLIAAGRFAEIDGVAARNIAGWDGQSWSPIGEGVNEKVDALLVDEEWIIAGGWFSGGPRKALRYGIARWNGQSWAYDKAAPADVRALTWHKSNLVAANGDGQVECWDGATWNALGDMDKGYLGGTIQALCSYHEELIAGGFFAQLLVHEKNSLVFKPINHIAIWDDTSWRPLAGGVYYERGRAIAPHYGGSWRYTGEVNAMTCFGDILIVAGDFSHAGGRLAKNIAQWDGRSWSSMGHGLNGNVYALAVCDNVLYAAGEIVARWDGTSWDIRAESPRSVVTSLAVFNGKIVAAHMSGTIAYLTF